MKEAILYEKLKNKQVRCLACNHKCLINESDVGICQVRKNINGKLFLLVYGKVISMAVDPIEKKPLYKFLPGTRAFSIGTVGCNFKCDFCQNFDISQASKGKNGTILGREVSCEEIVDMAIEGKCKSIAYTYNEPSIFIEFARDVAKLAKEKGLLNILVSNGYMSKEAFEFIKDYIDAVNIDLKSFNEGFYKKLCSGKLQPVLDTIKRFYDYGIHVELTTLLIEGENDSDLELEKIAKFIASIDKNIVWHISRFFPMHNMLNTRITGREKLDNAYLIGKKYLNHVYLGNV
jgi:pyruvate formate lyase activating enzyme